MEELASEKLGALSVTPIVNLNVWLIKSIGCYVHQQLRE